jgi:hypothetical protein
MAETEISRSDNEDLDLDEVELPLLPAATEEGSLKEKNRSINTALLPSQSDPGLLRDPLDRIRVSDTPSVDFDEVGGFSCKGTTASASGREADRLKDPHELHAYIVNYLSVMPPEIYIRMRGTHRDSSLPGGPVVDFDFVVSMRDVFALEYGQEGRVCGVVAENVRTFRGGKILRRGRRAELASDAESEKDLLEWCEDYCSDKSFRKQFRVTRTLEGYDFGAVKAAVTLMLRPEYLGKVEVGFTVVDQHVEICPPKLLSRLSVESKRIEMASKIVLIPIMIVAGFCLMLLAGVGMLALVLYWFGADHPGYLGLLFLRSLGIYLVVVAAIAVLYFSVYGVVSAIFDTRKWHIYNVNWSITTPSEESSGPSSARKYAGLSETQWVEKNAALLRRLVEGKFEGDATSFIDAPLTRSSRDTF